MLFGALLVVLAWPAGVAHGSEVDAVRRLLKDPSPSSRAAAIRRLAGDDARGVLALLVYAMGDRHPYVRRAAAGVAGQLVDDKARRRLSDLVRKQRGVRKLRAVDLRAAACDVYRHWLDERGREGLRDALTDRAPAVRIAALDALVQWASDARPTGSAGRPSEDRAVPPAPTIEDVGSAARALLDDRDGLVRAVALSHLQGMPSSQPSGRRSGWKGGKHAAGQAAGARGGVLLPAARWTQYTSDSDWRVRLAALEGSVAVGGDTAVVAVLHGLNEAVWSVRLTAAELAGTVADRRVLEALPALLADPRQRIRAAAHTSLVYLTGIPFDPDPKRWQQWLAGDGKAYDPADAMRAPAEQDAARRAAKLRPGTHTVVRALGVPVASGHIAFVLDTSGSMSEATLPGADGNPRSRWQAVCDEMRAATQRLDGAQIAVHCFSTDVRSFAKAPVRLTAAVRKRLAAFLDKQAVGGRTALFDGIERALADPDIDTVLVLSDGAPSAGSWFTKTDLLAGVRRANRWRRARIHVIAVGVDGIAKRWRDVLQRIAKGHGGRYVAR